MIVSDVACSIQCHKCHNTENDMRTTTTEDGSLEEGSFTNLSCFLLCNSKNTLKIYTIFPNQKPYHSCVGTLIDGDIELKQWVAVPTRTNINKAVRTEVSAQGMGSPTSLFSL